MARLVAAWLLAWAAGAAGASEAVPLAADPVLEAHVMRIAQELRCPVCQNETVAASQSALAVDLRRQIGRQIEEGRSQQQILDFMVERYGEFVRYRPALNAVTAVLWLGPFALLCGVLALLPRILRRRARDGSPDEPDEIETASAAPEGPPPGVRPGSLHRWG